MRDSIIKNTGNSRYLKSAISAATTWEQFRAALIAGTLPIDLNGINTAGWQQVGDALNKENLLPDGVVTAFGLPGSNPQVKDGISRLPWHKIQEWTTAGAYTWTAPDLFNGQGYVVGVLIVGGGGSGGASIYSRTSNGTSAKASGGASGYSKVLYLKVNPGGRYNLVVGAGGTGAVHTITTASNESFTDGNPGLSSSFNGVTVSGGGGGRGGAQLGQGPNGAIGGQPSRYPTDDDDTVNPFGGIPVYTKSGVLTDPDFVGCFNPFTFMRFLGAGGSAGVYTDDSGSTTVRTTPGGRDPLTNVGGSDGAARHINGLSSNITLYGKTPTSPGCGSGGAALKTNGNSGGYTLTARSMDGAHGEVAIYVMGESI